eukprot:Clim_evm77s218 gene=Clim_evmTU77s218
MELAGLSDVHGCAHIVVSKAVRNAVAHHVEYMADQPGDSHQDIAAGIVQDVMSRALGSFMSMNGWEQEEQGNETAMNGPTSVKPTSNPLPDTEDIVIPVPSNTSLSPPQTNRSGDELDSLYGIADYHSLQQTRFGQFVDWMANSIQNVTDAEIPLKFRKLVFNDIDQTSPVLGLATSVFGTCTCWQGDFRQRFAETTKYYLQNEGKARFIIRVRQHWQATKDPVLRVLNLQSVGLACSPGDTFVVIAAIDAHWLICSPVCTKVSLSYGMNIGLLPTAEHIATCGRVQLQAMEDAIDRSRAEERRQRRLKRQKPASQLTTESSEVEYLTSTDPNDPIIATANGTTHVRVSISSGRDSRGSVSNHEYDDDDEFDVADELMNHHNLIKSARYKYKEDKHQLKERKNKKGKSPENGSLTEIGISDIQAKSNLGSSDPSNVGGFDTAGKVERGRKLTPNSSTQSVPVPRSLSERQSAHSLPSSSSHLLRNPEKKGHRKHFLKPIGNRKEVQSKMEDMFEQHSLSAAHTQQESLSTASHRTSLSMLTEEKEGMIRSNSLAMTRDGTRRSLVRFNEEVLLTEGVEERTDSRDNNDTDASRARTTKVSLDGTGSANELRDTASVNDTGSTRSSVESLSSLATVSTTALANPFGFAGLTSLQPATRRRLKHQAAVELLQNVLPKMINAANSSTESKARALWNRMRLRMGTEKNTRAGLRGKDHEVHPLVRPIALVGPVEAKYPFARMMQRPIVKSLQELLGEENVPVVQVGVLNRKDRKKTLANWARELTAHIERGRQPIVQGDINTIARLIEYNCPVQIVFVSLYPVRLMKPLLKALDISDVNRHIRSGMLLRSMNQAYEVTLRRSKLDDALDDLGDVLKAQWFLMRNGAIVKTANKRARKKHLHSAQALLEGDAFHSAERICLQDEDAVPTTGADLYAKDEEIAKFERQVRNMAEKAIVTA